MEILSSRAILRPTDPDAALVFYRDTLGLAISREFPGGTVFFLGNGLLEVSAAPSGAPRGAAAERASAPGGAAAERASAPGGAAAERASAPGGAAAERVSAPDGRAGTAPHGPAPDTGGLRLWLQVRDLAAAHAELSDAGVPVLREPRHEPWGLHEMWIADPDGTRIVLVQIPPEHPIRRDTRGD